MSSKRALFASMAFVVILVTLDELRKGHAPRPRAFLAAYVVYVSLALMMQLGDSWARFAGAFSLLVALSVGLWKAPALMGMTQTLVRESDTGGGGGSFTTPGRAAPGGAGGGGGAW